MKLAHRKRPNSPKHFVIYQNILYMTAYSAVFTKSCDIKRTCHVTWWCKRAVVTCCSIFLSKNTKQLSFYFIHKHLLKQIWCLFLYNYKYTFFSSIYKWSISSLQGTCNVIEFSSLMVKLFPVYLVNRKWSRSAC